MSESRPVTSVAIVIDEHDPVAASTPVRWAAEQLRAALAANGMRAMHAAGVAAAVGDVVVLIAGAASPVARVALGASGVARPQAPEALAIVPTTVEGRRLVLACGSDVRGVVYAVLELADRITCSEDVSATVRQIL